MSKSCTTCKYEPVWNEIGRDGDDWPQLEGMCRAPRAACDARRLIQLDTEWMEPDWSGVCQMWTPKNEN
jgi:hypothetical protein